MLPDKSKGGKRKTKVKKHTLNPVFDEVLRFNISLSALEHRSLWLTVWHSDIFGRNEFLGEVILNLKGFVFDDPQPRSYKLEERTEMLDLNIRGDIVVALKFTSKNENVHGQLHVLIKEVKNLYPIKTNGTCDIFCKR